jgi:hypothetical protein
MRKAGKIPEDLRSEIEAVKAHYKGVWGGAQTG